MTGLADRCRIIFMWSWSGMPAAREGPPASRAGFPGLTNFAVERRTVPGRAPAGKAGAEKQCDHSH